MVFMFVVVCVLVLMLFSDIVRFRNILWFFLL